MALRIRVPALAPPTTVAFNPARTDTTIIALSAGNTVATHNPTNAAIADAMLAPSIGTGVKRYCEFDITSYVSGNDFGIFIANSSYSINGQAQNDANAVCYIQYPDIMRLFTSYESGTIPTIVTGLRIKVAVDTVNDKFWMAGGASGNWNGSATADPATNVGGIGLSALLGAGPYYLGAFFLGNDDVVTVKGAPADWIGTAPSGFSALNGATAGATGPVVVQTASGAVSLTTTLGVAFASAVTVGNTLIAAFWGFDGTTGGTFTVTDNKGNTWTKRQENIQPGSAATSIWDCVVTTGGAGLTVTVTALHSTVDLELSILEVAGLGAFDKSAGFSNSVASPAVVGPTAALASASELVVAVMSTASSGVSAATAGYTNIRLDAAGANTPGSADYKIVSSSSPVSASWAFTGGANYTAASLATWQAAAGGGATTYANSIALAAAGGVSTAALLTAQAAATIAATGGLAGVSQATMASAVGLAASLAQSALGGTAYANAIGLAASGGANAAAAATLPASIGLAAAGGLSAAAQGAFAPALAIAVSAGLAPSVALNAVASLSLVAALGQTAGASLTIGQAMALAAAAGITPVGALTIPLAASIAAAMAASTSATLTPGGGGASTYNEALTFACSAALSASGRASMASAASLAAAISVAVSQSLTMAATSAIAATSGVTAAGRLVVSGSITLGAAGGLAGASKAQFSGVVGFTAQFDQVASAQLTAQAAAAIAAQIAIGVATGAVNPLVAEITLEGTRTLVIDLAGLRDGPRTLSGKMQVLVDLAGITRN
jgi:trimeric autotransporter adhesin